MLNSPTFWSFLLLGFAVLRLEWPSSTVRTLLLVLINAAGLHWALKMGILDLAITYGSAAWVTFWAVSRPEAIRRRPEVASLLLIIPLLVVWSAGKSARHLHRLPRRTCNPSEPEGLQGPGGVLSGRRVDRD